MIYGNNQLMKSNTQLGPSPVFEGYTGWTVQSGNPTSISLAYPTGTSENDILIIVIMTYLYDTLSSLPSGWTELSKKGSSWYEQIIWKRADGTESGNLILDLINDSSYPTAGAYMLRISGCTLTGSPFDTNTVGNTVSSRSSQSLTHTGTEGNNRLGIAIYSLWDDVSSPTFNNGTWTRNYFLASTAGNDTTHIVYSQQITTAGSTGGAVGYSFYSEDVCCGIIFILKPLNS